MNPMKEIHETNEENQTLTRVNRYFRGKGMSLEEKLFYAKLIATLDLESGQYTTADQKEHLKMFSASVDKLRKESAGVSTQYGA
ncbi:hypothetical protein [Heliobacterium mobile]|nr:hypothetical protein [Heliobacterium mobile]